MNFAKTLVKYRNELRQYSDENDDELRQNNGEYGNELRQVNGEIWK